MIKERDRIRRIIINSRAFHLLYYVLAFAGMIAAYTVIFYHFYPILEGRPIGWDHALLFVVETISTTGYGELLPFTSNQMVIFSAVMIISGVIMIFMVIPLLIGPYLLSVLHRRPPQKAPHVLTNHVVIIGFNSLMSVLIDNLDLLNREVIILEEDEQKARQLSQEIRHSAFIVWGNHENDDVWNAVCIDAAAYVVIGRDERISADIILGIRERCSGKIISVVDDIAFERYLTAAGADHVISPKMVTGSRLGLHAAQTFYPEAIEKCMLIDTFIKAFSPDTLTLRFIPVVVMPGSRSIGKEISALGIPEKYGFKIVVILEKGVARYPPYHNEIVRSSMVLFVIGPQKNVHALITDLFMVETDGDKRAIVGGYGDVGLAACRELIAFGISISIIDKDPDKHPDIVGDTEDLAIIEQANPWENDVFIAALNDDSRNIFATLISRDLNPSLHILARANNPSSVRKLFNAGADFVSYLPSFGGQMITNLIFAEEIQILLDLPDDQKVLVTRSHNSNPVPVSEIEKKTGVIIIGIDGMSCAIPCPDAATHIQAGDVVFLMGRKKQLKRFLKAI